MVRVKKYKNNTYAVNAMLRQSSLIIDEIILFFLQKFLTDFHGENLIDIGAGDKPYYMVYKDHFAECISTDVASSHHNISHNTYVAPAHSIPTDNESFDCIICTEVLEHVKNPFETLQEFSRVLRPEGRVFLTVPYIGFLHETPFDFYRYTPYALHDLFERNGFKVEAIYLKGGLLATILYLLNSIQFKLWNKLSKVLRVNLKTPFNPIVLLFSHLPQKIYGAHYRKKYTQFIFQDKPTFSNSISLGYVVFAHKYA